MSERVARLQQSLEEPLLVSSRFNVRYLVGLESSNAALLVEPDRVRLFTDFRYVEAARAVDGVELVETRRTMYPHLAELLDGRIGFEAAQLSYERYGQLSSDGLELVPRVGLVEALRAVKDTREIDSIRRAAAIADGAFERIAAEPFVGKTERQVAWRLEQLMHELGADAAAFEVIVASGPNSALPHARPTDRVIGAGETVVVDAGCTFEGYCSDCTRTFATGSLPAELQEAYEVCRRAQEAGLAAVAPGQQGNDVDWAARDVIELAGLGDRFGHGLGHGVGLEVHERPWLNTEVQSTLEPGNVVTVEPGIYLPASGGVRIEDLVLVTDGGAEVLSSVAKDLVTVG
jgi:Xaa-Pro aminopeptidase